MSNEERMIKLRVKADAIAFNLFMFKVSLEFLTEDERKEILEILSQHDED